MKHLILLLTALLAIGFSAQAQKLNRKGLPMVKKVYHYWHLPDDPTATVLGEKFNLYQTTEYEYDEEDECKSMKVTTYKDNGEPWYTETITREKGQFHFSQSKTREELAAENDGYWSEDGYQFIATEDGKIGVIRCFQRVAGSRRATTTVFLFDEFGRPKMYEQFGNNIAEGETEETTSSRWFIRNRLTTYEEWLEEFEKYRNPGRWGRPMPDGTIGYENQLWYTQDGDLVRNGGTSCGNHYDTLTPTSEIERSESVYDCKEKYPTNLTYIYPYVGYSLGYNRLPLEWTGFMSNHIAMIPGSEKFNYIIDVGYRIKEKVYKDPKGNVTSTVHTVNGHPHQKYVFEYVREE